jgi:predicted transcriptional regulator
MARSRPRPTDAELAILGVLWTEGPATVRHVHETLADARETGYTTTLKLMQIMAEKGLVTRDESARTHVYTAGVSRDDTQRQLVSDLVDPPSAALPRPWSCRGSTHTQLLLTCWPKFIS